MKIKSAKGKDYYALVCDCGVGKDRYMICGVLASRKEAQGLAREVKDCVAKHSIKKVSTVVRWK